MTLLANESDLITQAKCHLQDVKAGSYSLEQLQDRAIALSSLMLKEGDRIQTPEEKAKQQQLAAMMDDPTGKTFTFYMADQCFRSHNTGRIADQVVYLLHKFGIPQYLSWIKQFQMKIFSLLGKTFSPLMVPAMMYVMRKETESVILPGEEIPLAKHIAIRKSQGVKINLNHLGEAILGEAEALGRLQLYIDDLSRAEIDYVSVKISTLYSQINMLATEKTIEALSERLRMLYRAAMNHKSVGEDGGLHHKFVNLDMEEYKDLRLTVDLYKKVLDEEEFLNFSAGIVLQAYLPDSYEIQKEITQWATSRCKRGGASVKIRIVKGANLAMEKVEAALKGWEAAPYAEKVDVDANYRRMVIFGSKKEHAKAVHLGIGSHNLFDIAFAMLLRAQNGVENEVCFEMLEGMADHLRIVVQKISGGILLYCPAAKKEEFQNAVAYLIRRLDENTAPENFLRHAFHLQEGSAAWLEQVEFFRKGFSQLPKISSGPRRLQNRYHEVQELPANTPFANEADTDFSLPHNQKWGREILQDWSRKEHSPLPIVVGGKEYFLAEQGKGIDPSNPSQTLYKYSMASAEHAEEALMAATVAPWGRTSVAERSAIMAKAAHKMRLARKELVGVMVADAGKTVVEADLEVSEAVDMVDYYRRCMEELSSHSDVRWTPKGVILVIPPWNFPCAIPVGGIVSALMAGNSVIFKPARDTVLVGWMLVNILWEAGVPKEALQFLTGSSSVIGNKLIQDPRVSGVILTGSTATGKHMLKLRPRLHLMAETGGKNSIIVTNMADRDLAIKETIHSAFGHAGQKCSAASLLILEEEIYNDPHFRKQLQDAAASLTTGSAWDPGTKVNPLIHPPEEDLRKGLTTLDEGESWLLQPKNDPQNPHLWSPGIKWGVKEGSYSHQTEFFGPVLGVMCAKNLDQAITFANGTKYGLTAGLHSLDEREHAIWLKKIQAGNLYINRSITGAIVRRQPFGGCKESCIGPGSKAGGPNYLIHLMNAEQIAKSPKDYTHWAKWYQKPQDPSLVLGQDNFLTFVPWEGLTLRIQKGDSPSDIEKVRTAADLCNTKLEISAPIGMGFIEEEEDSLIERIRSGEIKRLRVLSIPSDKIMEAAAYSACYVCQATILDNGRVELLNYLREVAICIDYHRYGNLGEREQGRI